MYYQFSMQYFLDAFQPIMSCMKVTLLITFASFIFAFLFAIILAVIAMSKNRVVQAVLKVWLSLFRGTPP